MSHNVTPGQSGGISTRVLLMAAMTAVIVTASLASLLLIRHQLKSEVNQAFSRDLERSVGTFQDLQTQRLNALDHENALLADQSSLKALMTTHDAPTIRNGAPEFRNVSGNDLFALADMEGHVVAAFAGGGLHDEALAQQLEPFVATPSTVYLVSDRGLFACSVRPLYFGSEASGALLGYVISGYSIDRAFLEQISGATMVEASFISHGVPLVGTLPSATRDDLARAALPHAESGPQSMQLGDQKYLAVSVDLTRRASAPLHLVVMKSFEQADLSIRQIDRLILIAGALALALGTLLMFALSHAVTRPLVHLAASVRAFGSGDSAHFLPLHGTREVRDLSMSFSKMRQEIQQTHRALLESERLATIGRMASSVSHDLRHYLAAVYANAEFLASARLTETERTEILADIHAAVYGTTELIESMLIFSRTGNAIRRAPELVATVVERAIALIHKHPDSAGVVITADYGDPAATMAVVDGKQIERAVYNLLLNACQSRSTPAEIVHAAVKIEVQDEQIAVEVKDDGAGVPMEIRSSLFKPFVSQGKQKGSGLGLTLAHCIAAEHGGYLVLVGSRPGETIFRMCIARDHGPEDSPGQHAAPEVANEASTS